MKKKGGERAGGSCESRGKERREKERVGEEFRTYVLMTIYMTIKGGTLMTCKELKDNLTSLSTSDISDIWFEFWF